MQYIEMAANQYKSEYENWKSKGLRLMCDTISKAYTHGLLHSERPSSGSAPPRAATAISR